MDALQKTKSCGGGGGGGGSGGGGGLSVLYMICGTTCCRKFLVPARTGIPNPCMLSLYHSLCTD